MNKELRQRISNLLSDTINDISDNDKEEIINKAYQRLSSKKSVNEENIIDAVLAAFQDEEYDDIYFKYTYENEDEDDLFNLLRTSSYEDDIINGALSEFEKSASSEYDYYRGAKGSDYSEKGKDFRPPKSKNNKKKNKDENMLNEFEILDGVHDDIQYHNEATKTKNTHRTKADMLSRSS